MNILKSVKKIPGGLMVVPLLLGAIINTFFGGTIWTMFDGTFTTYLWKSGAMPILAVFIFCNATTINFKKAGVTVYKGVVITAVKVGVGIIIGLICGKLFGEAGFLGLSTLAIVGALANSNGGLYAALAGEYGDARRCCFYPFYQRWSFLHHGSFRCCWCCKDPNVRTCRLYHSCNRWLYHG